VQIFELSKFDIYVLFCMRYFSSAIYWQRSEREKNDVTLVKEMMSTNFSPDPVIKDLMTRIFSIEVRFDNFLPEFSILEQPINKQKVAAWPSG
jgi:hypothetical protein